MVSVTKAMLYTLKQTGGLGLITMQSYRVPVISSWFLMCIVSCEHEALRLLFFSFFSILFCFVFVVVVVVFVLFCLCVGGVGVRVCVCGCVCVGVWFRCSFVWFCSGSWE